MKFRFKRIFGRLVRDPNAMRARVNWSTLDYLPMVHFGPCPTSSVWWPNSVWCWLVAKHFPFVQALNRTSLQLRSKLNAERLGIRVLYSFFTMIILSSILRRKKRRGRGLAARKLGYDAGFLLEEQREKRDCFALLVMCLVATKRPWTSLVTTFLYK